MIDLADWKAEEPPGYEGTAFAVDGTSSGAGRSDARIYAELGVDSPWPLAAIISFASNGARIICVPITAKQRRYRGLLLRTTVGD